MRRAGITILLLIAALSACSTPSHHAHATATRPGHLAPGQPGSDPRTAAALIRIAQVFNDNYDANHDGPVWDRWDARSQALISRAAYIRRHAECLTAPTGPAHVESAAPGPRRAWLVHYDISGTQLTDYWFYTGHRWEFDLLLSNPSAARAYPLPFARYAAAVGCADH